MRSFVLMVLATGCAAAPTAPTARPAPEWVERGSGMFGAQDEFLDGVASSEGSPDPSQVRVVAARRAGEALDTLFGDFVNTVTASITDGVARTAFVDMAGKLRARIRPVEYERADGTWFALTRLNKKEVVLAIGTSRTLPGPKKAILLEAVGATLVPPQWLHRGTGHHDGVPHGVGAVQTLQIENFGLAQAAAGNRARAALATLLGKDGAAMAGAEVYDYWLDDEAVLHAVARIAP